MLTLRPFRQRLLVFTTAAVLAVTAVPLVATSTLAAPTPLGVNLVRNPGAEEGAGTNGYATVAIPGWVREANSNFTVVRYGSPDFPTKAESGRFGGGRKFFSCGPTNALDSLAQTLVVKGRGGLIDSGLIRVRLNVRQAGYSNGPDLAQAVLYFIDAGGSQLDVLATDATSGTFGVFKLKKATTVLPAGTRRIVVGLQGTRGNDGGSYCDAYFDNVRVVLQRAGGPLAGS